MRLEGIKKNTQFWSKQLQDIEKYVKFYNIQSNNYNTKAISLENEAIDRFLKDKGIFKFDFMASILSLYLSRVDNTEGCLLNTVTPDDNHIVLKIPYDKNSSFMKHLSKTSEIHLEAAHHSEMDVDEIISHYFIYDFTQTKDDMDMDDENSALVMKVHDDSLEVVYNSDLFEDIYIEHMLENIKTLIGNVLKSPKKACKDISILSENEETLLLNFSKGKTLPVENKTFSQKFRENAIENPDNLAVDDGTDKITYGELEKSTNSIAHDLKNNYNICSNKNVGVMLGRNYHFPEIVIALNKLGISVIPIDPLYPTKRIKHMLDICRTTYIITAREFEDKFDDLKCDLIFTEDLNRENHRDIEIMTNEDDLFMVIFTSGTTGLPKGVMIPNSQINAMTTIQKEMYNLPDYCICGCYRNFSFVGSFRMYSALILGHGCRIFNEKEQKDSLLLLEILKNEPINDVDLPPAIGVPIAENEDINLRAMSVGGSKLDEYKNLNEDISLINVYGSSEVLFVLSNQIDRNKNNVSLGKPNPNSEIYVIDDNGMQMPIGVPGEICVLSRYISSGYYNNKEQTEKAFTTYPDTDKRLYHMGDIGFYNFDGEIEFIGRRDNQLSVRGFRVESDEILSIMNKFNAFEDIYLDVDNDNLIAYYTAHDSVNIDEVRDSLKDELPYYMVPSLFIELDEIPLNVNGKIDKFAMRNIYYKKIDDDITDEILKEVLDSFKEVLKNDYISINDDFVRLGGNSLSAMNLQKILKDRLDVSLSSSEIVELSTPIEISNRIKFDMNIHSKIELNKYSFESACPLSESHLNIYLDEKVKDMGTAYNNSFKIIFNKNYSSDEIKKAISKLCERFPILKTRVINDDHILSFVFDSDPEITENTSADMTSFIKPFELDRCLSKFMIVESESVLCINLHHLIFDGTSINILVDNLIGILNNQSVDFVDDGVLRQISFEEHKLDEKYMIEGKKFFNTMLADREEAYELMNCVNPDDEFIYDDDIDLEDFDLSSYLQNHNVTYNQFFCSVFAYTLSRFTGSSKALFNLIEDGRGHIDLKNSIGMFVKTLPVLIDCSDKKVSTFLEDSSGLINTVMKYDLYPFRYLAKEYDLNSGITFQYAHDIFSDFDNEHSNLEIIKTDAINDLSFFVYDIAPNRFGIKVTFSENLSKGMIEQFIKTFKLILKGIVSADNLSDISYTDASDLMMLDEYNRTEKDLMYDDILEIFNEHLSKNPENNLVSMDGKTYSYCEGAYIAGRIAERLKELGVKSQDCVGFLTHRSEYYMFAVLGILSIGAINVPLDNNHPDERLSFIMNDTRCRVVIVSDETCKRMDDLNRDMTVLNISDIVNGAMNKSYELASGYGKLASILYTSGSTGTPKGVRITRKAILNVAIYYRDTYELSSDDVYALYPSIGFDAGFESLFKAISVGACLSIVPEDIKYNMRELNGYFIKENVTHAIITTQVGKLFMQSVEDTSLKYLFVGGEKLGKFTSPKGYKLIDEYGPTEANNFISSIDNNEKIDYSSVGRLNYNTKTYILDAEQRRVPVDAVGELCISGYQVADGYLNRSEENAKSFVENPFSEDENYSMMYRTGDLVRMLPDGSLSIVGRSDGQVKIRGNRVELSEIEATIRELDCVSDVTVQTVREDSNNKLVAYVVTTNEIDENELSDSISDYISRFKPDYMVPSYVIKLDEIPLNVNSKVDKQALPDVNMESLKVKYVEGKSRTEKLIIEAFKNVFNQEKIGLYDDFIKLGGDSLSAIKLLDHLGDAQITAADILTLRTPYAISKKISEYALNLDLYSLDEGCPLNESQLNVYLDVVVNNKTDSYILPLTMEIEKRYDLHNGLEKMFEAHPILGMHIKESSDVPYLVKGRKPEIIVKSEVSEEFINEFKTKQFDLNESLCRFLIIEGDESYELIAIFHHIIFDGLSDPIFKRDLMNILEGCDVDVDDSFLKVSAFSQQISMKQEYGEARKFFEGMLADREEAGTLLDDICCDGPGSHMIDLNIDNDLLKEFLDEYSVSENVLFTGTFAYTMSRFAGNEKVLFNIVENGRDRFNNFDAIGMFVNTLPMFVECENQSVHSFMDSMSNRIYDVMKYNYYPFRFLAREYDLNVGIIFQYMPDWFNKNDNEIENIDIKDMTDFITDFSCEVIQIRDEYKLRITYSNRYSLDMVKRFSQTYNLILSQLINVKTLGEINYNTQSDLDLLDLNNQTEHELQYHDIMDIFSQHLLKNPDNKLVSMDNRSYTYSEGAFIIREVVNRLKQLGVESGDCVSFLVERSEWYMFSAISILSMGCVYVPLDDGLPDERIKFILNDTRSRAVIVTDSTYERAKGLSEESIILNVSDILSKPVESANSIDVDYGDLACILYTSGTTGTPKGVKVTRLAILNASTVYVDRYGMENDDVYGLYASIGFDVGSLALWSAVNAGASLSIIPEDIKLDMIKLNDYIVSQGVTFSAMTTQVAKLFMKNIKDTTLKLLSVGGEKLGEIESPDYRLIDEFGPTEAFGFVSSINNLEKIHPTSVGSINYNTKTYVLDAEKRRVPYGAVGELYLAGNQIADGYLNREKQTKEAFVENPFTSDENYSRLYRTGDLVRYLPDATIGIIGRQDNQVKIRGNRVELSEVELTILDMKHVKDVTVQTVKRGSNNELVAYVVLSEEITDLRDYVCDYVGQYKPSYMVPSYVMSLDEIPLNINGKVDKSRLPQVSAENKEYEYPENFIEKAIAMGFSDVLGLTKPVSRNDEFNALGGDSISVMQLIVKLREINLHISVKEILDNQSVKKIAEKAEYKLSTNQISQDPFEGFVESTPITRYFWESNFSEPSYFNQALLFEASEKIDMDILKKAMQAVVNHHDMLRAIVKDRKLFVRPSDDENIFTIENCSPLDYGKETERLNRELDIFNGPLIKLAIFEDEDADYLYVTIHHLIVDGISWRIILEDLNLAYMQLVNNSEITLPSKTSSYRDYALAINEYKNDKQLLKQKPYWENVLNTMKTLKHTKISHDGRNHTNVEFKIPRDKSMILLTNALKKYDSSINGLFLSAILKSWNKSSGEDKLSVRIEGHGRENFSKDLLIERTVGWFSISYSLILKSDSQKNDEIIAEVEEILDSVPQKGFGFPTLMGIETDETPLVSFNYLGELNAIKSGEMFTTTYKPGLANPISPDNDYRCDITINGFSLNREIIFSLNFNTDEISEETIEKFSKGIMTTLNEIADSCSEDDYTDDIKVFSSHPDRKNLFIVHSANFGSEFFYYLGQSLKDDYSFYVIEPYNLNHIETPLTSIEEFAEKYINIIKSIQPEGPYYIGGFCFGGSIAHEMAIKLTEENEKVEKLVIFDSNNIEDNDLKKMVIEDQILYAHKYQQGGVLNRKEISIEDMVVQSKLAGVIWQNYKPRYYDGPTIFFKSTKKPEGITESSGKMYDYLLSKKAGGFEDYYNEDKLKIIEVPVEHNNIFSNVGLEIIVPEVKKFID